MSESPFPRLSTLRGWRLYGAAAGFGVLSAAALPPLHAIPILLITIPALLAMIDQRRGPLVAGIVGFWFGFGHHVAGLYWITEAILIEVDRFWWLVPFAVPAIAAVLALFVALPCAIARMVPAGWPRVCALAGAWVLADLARQFVATGFPWNPIGSVWAAPGAVGDLFLQPAAYLSVHGLTLLTLLLASTPALGPRGIVVAACAFVAWAGVGFVRLSLLAPFPTQQAAPGTAVVLVQGNIPQGRKWNPETAKATFDTYLQMSRDGVTEAKRIFPRLNPVVVWPETASPFLLDQDPAARGAIVDATRIGFDSVPVLAGSVRFDEARRPRNSLMALEGFGPPVAIYDKWHLVPFGEYQPSWFPLPIQVVPGGGFASGPGPATLHVANLPSVGVLVCYEAIFPGQVVDRTDRPAWLVNVTNDAWFGNSAGPRQHLAAARMRAVEEGLPMMRAANTGISAGFDAFGQLVGRIGMNTAGVSIVVLPPALPPTPFARFGLPIPIALSLLTLLAGLMAKFRQRDKN